MRRLLVLFLVLIAATPLTALAARGNDGSLAVRDGRGKVHLVVKGSLIGRLGNGSITLEELSDGNLGTEPVVRGYRTFRWGRNGQVRTYTGKSMRFRLIGGRYRVTFTGRGLHFSLVGRGRVQIDGSGSLEDGIFYDGFYSLNGNEEESLPDEATWMTLQAPPPPPPPPSS